MTMLAPASMYSRRRAFTSSGVPAKAYFPTRAEKSCAYWRLRRDMAISRARSPPSWTAVKM